VTLRVGTSGWHYDDWRGSFYPRELATPQWLHHYATCFDTVEINNSFYRLPERSTFEKWRDATPDDFRFTVKASRFLTHQKRLRDPGEPVSRLLRHASALGSKLGPVLLQVPPNLPADQARLADVLAAFGDRVRVACEFRHPSWDSDDILQVLESHNAALCLTDRRGRHGALVRTASWAFVRLHEGTASPTPCYGRRALHTWADRIVELFGTHVDVYVYFNNDHNACAVGNARSFLSVAHSAGLDVRRSPCTPPAISRDPRWP
jgi:uncharacterized protein YecE (DUF72 family)